MANCDKLVHKINTQLRGHNKKVLYNKYYRYQCHSCIHI